MQELSGCFAHLKVYLKDDQEERQKKKMLAWLILNLQVKSVQKENV